MNTNDNTHAYVEVVQFYTDEIKYHQMLIKELQSLLAETLVGNLQGLDNDSDYHNYDVGGTPDWWGVQDAVNEIEDDEKTK
jgi:hypothetical protein